MRRLQEQVLGQLNTLAAAVLEVSDRLDALASQQQGTLDTKDFLHSMSQLEARMGKVNSKAAHSEAALDRARDEPQPPPVTRPQPQPARDQSVDAPTPIGPPTGGRSRRMTVTKTRVHRKSSTAQTTPAPSVSADEPVRDAPPGTPADEPDEPPGTPTPAWKRSMRKMKLALPSDFV